MLLLNSKKLDAWKVAYFIEQIDKPRIFSGAGEGKEKHIFPDNASDHNASSKAPIAIAKLKTEIRKLPETRNHSTLLLFQGSITYGESHGIFKEAKESNIACMARDLVRNVTLSFMVHKKCSKCTEAITSKQLENEMKITRKAMIRSEISLDMNKIWHMGL